MTTNRVDQNIRELVVRDVASISIPSYNPSAIDARARAHAGTRPMFASSPWRIALGCVLALGVLVLGIPGVSAVVAKAKLVFQAFDANRVSLDVREVTLDQARADMPFRVIAPAAIPAGLQATIRELRSSRAPAEASVVFEYRHDPNSIGLPPVVITESAAATSATPHKIMFMAQPQSATKLKNGNANQPPPQVRRMVKLDTASWVVSGTQIQLMSAPGALSPEAIRDIRAAMSR